MKECMRKLLSLVEDMERENVKVELDVYSTSLFNYLIVKFQFSVTEFERIHSTPAKYISLNSNITVWEDHER